MGIGDADLSLELTCLKESTVFFTLRDFLIIADLIKIPEHFKTYWQLTFEIHPMPGTLISALPVVSFYSPNCP